VTKTEAPIELPGGGKYTVRWSLRKRLSACGAPRRRCRRACRLRRTASGSRCATRPNTTSRNTSWGQPRHHPLPKP
jgi:hypothetical protein